MIDFLQPIAVAAKGAALDRFRGGTAAAAYRQTLPSACWRDRYWGNKTSRIV